MLLTTLYAFLHNYWTHSVRLLIGMHLWPYLLLIGLIVATPGNASAAGGEVFLQNISGEPRLQLSSIQEAIPFSTPDISTHRATMIGVGYNHTCALLTSGGVKCWRNGIPESVSGLTSGVSAIATSDTHACALLDSGGVKCWGSNFKGQLGDGTTSDSSMPVDVSGLTSGVSAIAINGRHSCAVLSTGAVKCWGWNSDGQLGDGTTSDSSMPVDVSGLTSGVSAISTGYFHTCALLDSGSVKCWGENGSGQLGSGGLGTKTMPVDVSGLTSSVSAIAAGFDHSCALLSTGGIACWGENSYGQLGNGTQSDSTSPVDVSGLASEVSNVTVGSGYSCALLDSGGVKCWGWNSDGALGDGTGRRRTTPVDVSGLASGVSALAAGGTHTCALLDSGGVKCWGYGYGMTPKDVYGLETTLPVISSMLIDDGATYATSTNVTMALSVANDVSGIAGLSLSNDGSTWSDWQLYENISPWTLTVGDGFKTVFARVMDGAANVSIVVSATISLDTQAPTSSVTANGGAPYTDSSQLSLEISAIDSSSGVTQMSLSNNGISWSDWESYAVTKSWRVDNGDGLKTVYIQFMDHVGNVSQATTTTITLDTTAPEAVIYPISAFQPSRSFTVTWTGSDAGSGLASYDVEYMEDDGAWTAWQSSVTQTQALFTGDDGVTYAFRARARDAVGNVSNYAAGGDVQTRVDETAPAATSLVVNGGALATTTPNVTIALLATDDVSGIAGISFSDDGSTWSEWQAPEETTMWTLATDDGAKTLYARARNGAGLLSAVVSDTINLDTGTGNAPAASINMGALFTNRTEVMLTLGAPAHTMQMMVSNDGGFSNAVWEAFDTHKPWEITKFGKYVLPRTVYVRYKSVSGVVSESVQDDIILDVTPPHGSVQVTTATTQTASSAAIAATIDTEHSFSIYLPFTCGVNCSLLGNSIYTLRLTAEDDVSGVATALISTDSTFTHSTQVLYISTPTQILWQAPEGAKEVYVSFIDYAGNVSNSVSQPLAP